MLQRKRTRFSATIRAIPILITGLFAAPAAWAYEAPVADAGPHRRCHLGEFITLDGSGSYDPDGGALTDYLWAIDSAPPGSSAALSDPGIVNPTFTPDELGDYVFSLIVSKDNGTSWSYPDTAQLKVGVLYAFGENPDLQIIETRLTNDPTPQFDAAVSGANTVYMSLQNGSMDIYRIVLDGDPGLLVGGAGNQTEPDIDGSTVVYTDDNGGLQDVWWYDWLTADHFSITVNPFADVTPAISGNNVVYDGYVGMNHDIYWFSCDTGEVAPLTATAPPESHPDIDGNLVAWMVYSDVTSSYDIVGTVLGGADFTVADSDIDESAPSVSGNLISYSLEFDVGWYDHATGETVRLTQDAWSQPVSLVSGNAMYFTDNRTGSAQIYVHVIDTGDTYQLTDQAVLLSLDDVDGQTVVFSDMRDGNPEVYRLTWGFDQPPVADAGEDQTVFVDELVQLDGIGSYDPDGQSVSDYSWSIETTPNGSTAELDSPLSISPTFVPDIAGDYIISLIVQAGGVWSDPDYVTITADSLNSPPIADAGPDQPDAIVGSLVTLDGTGSWDPDEDPLDYDWEFLADPPGLPPGSTATLDDPSSATPSFTPDVEGLYVIVLSVFDGCEWSTPDIVQVTASPPNPPPVAVIDADPYEGATPLTVQFDGTGSYDPEGEDLTYDWDFDDGSPHSSEPAPEHVFVEPRSYQVTLCVTDEAEQTDCATAWIDVTYPGACCLVDGSCVETGEADCLQMGGDYQGEGVSCDRSICPIPGDLDGDGDVDWDDYDLFADCLTGADTPPPGGCEAADLDWDGDVDLEDFALFQRIFEG